MTDTELIRFRNPFRNPLVSELIDDPGRYKKMFSSKVLVGETLDVFQPSNVVLLGPQGTGKSMILNLLRFPVLQEYFQSSESLPGFLKHVDPFLGISINLQRANFHIFGRRSISKTMGHAYHDPGIDSSCAADFLIHYLFVQFLEVLLVLRTSRAAAIRGWLGIPKPILDNPVLAKKIAKWPCWFGYYSSARNMDQLLQLAEKRLSAWKLFLNAASDTVPAEIWSSKVVLEEPLHFMGNLLGEVSKNHNPVPLFVVVDQYEVLPHLNPHYGTRLQRVVNSLIKTRDPVAFIKIGARSHDWGKELRVWGSESRIEQERDYTIVDLTDCLMRKEDPSGWLFPRLAFDVAFLRLKAHGYSVREDTLKRALGPHTSAREIPLYLRKDRKQHTFMGKLPAALQKAIIAACGPSSSPLDLRLASAWALQKLQAGKSEASTASSLEKRPWDRQWWKKERVETALLQIASACNQRKQYFGSRTIIMLAGFNVTAFLIILREIWDQATKLGIDPLKPGPLDPSVQTRGISTASHNWAKRDRDERSGGSERFAVISRLGPAIRDNVLSDLAISNPGHTGFSLRESDLEGGVKTRRLVDFLDSGVNWAIFEERPHTSKFREGTKRRKYYLHPLLSPSFEIPYKRVKEPFYVSGATVFEWFFENQRIRFGTRKSR